MKPLAPLPIDPCLPEIVETLRREKALVLQAPPGAGKTTRVPRALDDAGVVDGEIIVLEPRRLAARMAARRMADERGEKVGARVGYHVRFEDVSGPDTRVRFVTEGLLMRRLLAAPTLPGVGAVLLDEFHERHLHGDVTLALLRRLQATRPELRLVVMSATLDVAPVAAFLGDCPIVQSEGRPYDVTVEYVAGEGELDVQVARAVRRLVQDGLDGDVLVFLPGAREIRRAEEACQGIAKQADLEVVALHGDLPPEAQDRAVRPGPRRKVILSTNVAETSVTIEGVVAVVDSGLARVASHAPWSGLPTLKVQKVSRASAAQRAGRAGRTRPGRCLRLYPRHDHDARPAHELPEIRRLDLAETVLTLAELGVHAPAAFKWFEAPPEAALETARELLRRLGAIDPSGAPTELGRRMARLPTHPRLARLVVEAARRGVGPEGCRVAALISEPAVVRDARAKVSGPADVLWQLDLFAEAERARFDRDKLRWLGLDVGATLSVDRVRRQLEGLVRAEARRPKAEDPDAALGLSILAAYPDRVARRRRPGGSELLLSGGGTAQLAESSVVRDAELMVAIDAEERGQLGRGGAVTVRSASRIEPEWLLDLFAERMRETTEALWNEAAARVEVVRRMWYDQLVLDERRTPARPEDGPEVGQALAKAALQRGLRQLVDGEALDRLIGRAAFVRAHAPDAGVPALDEAQAEAALAELCRSATSFAELEGDAVLHLMLEKLSPPQRRALDELAPERMTLPGGRALKITYIPGQPPFVQSRLQDFFGMADGPKLLRGRVPLTLHLLAPNQRAVQVTSDLAGFWARHYPSVRRELCRKYPKHAWPEDPLAASPPARRR